MELLLTLALLYLWQCTRSVPPGARLFVRLGRHWAEQPGGGRRLCHPRPGGVSLVGLAEPTGEHRPARDLSRTLESALAASRALAWLSDAYAVWLFGLLPAWVLWAGEERALWLAVVPTFALHAWGVLLAARAHRRLRPGGASDLWEWLSVCALYPPALLRARHDLVTDACDGYASMSIRAAFQARERFVDQWRREQARLGRAAAGMECVRARRALLEALRVEQEIGRDEIEAPRPRSDASAASYCPACLSDYRPGFDRCRECELDTVRYA